MNKMENIPISEKNEKQEHIKKTDLQEEPKEESKNLKSHNKPTLVPEKSQKKTFLKGYGKKLVKDLQPNKTEGKTIKDQIKN